MAALQQHSSVKGGLQPTVAFFDWFHLDETLLRDYARANASIGINGSVLNNVNASPKMLTKPYLQEVQKIARILRPYGIRVYLSINFATPMALGDTKTADPLDKSVSRWWKKKWNTECIYFFLFNES